VYLLLEKFLLVFYSCIIVVTCQVGSGLVGDDDAFGSSGAVAARIESSYMINLRDLDMRHVKDFTFVYGECKRILIFIILSLKYIFLKILFLSIPNGIVLSM